jgi:hypothetical protein
MIGKKAEASLTWILIASITGLTLMVLSFTAYDQFMKDNLIDIDEDYDKYYENITYYESKLSDKANELDDKNILTKIWNSAIAGMGVFVSGLDAITKLFEMLPILKEIIEISKQAIPGFETLFGLSIIIITIYIAMSFIKARRGTPQMS